MFPTVKSRTPLPLSCVMLGGEETAMHIRMACTLFVASTFAGAFLPAAAQVTPAPAQQQQSPLERNPPAHRSLQAPEVTERTSARFFTFSRDVQARTQQILQGPSQEQTEAAADLPPTCAHILIYVAPPSADDRMMIKLPRDYSNPTPAFQGLPPCRRDYRPMFFAGLGPEFRFVKPGGPDSPLPGLEKPSSLTPPK